MTFQREKLRVQKLGINKWSLYSNQHGRTEVKVNRGKKKKKYIYIYIYQKEGDIRQRVLMTKSLGFTLRTTEVCKAKSLIL